jgi:hypothetical protein
VIEINNIAKYQQKLQHHSYLAASPFSGNNLALIMQGYPFRKADMGVNKNEVKI